MKTRFLKIFAIGIIVLAILVASLSSFMIYDNGLEEVIQESIVIIPKGSYVMDNNLTFEPKEITVVIGVNNTIRWLNQETTPVFINSINGNWTSLKINPNESEFLLFVESGIYEYFAHPWMQGKVVVLEFEDFAEPESLDSFHEKLGNDCRMMFGKGTTEMYDCLEKIEPIPEPEPTSIDHQNLIDARNKLREIYDIDSSLGPFNIKDVIVGHGMGDGFLIVDILKEYYDSAEDRELIIQKIVDITGGNVDIEFNSSGVIAPTNIEFVFPYVWNSFLNRNGIEFTPKEQSYANTDIGYERQNRVCSPIVASNGTEFYISSIFTYEPFEITGTFIDKIKPDDCYKVWKTDTVLVEPDRILMLWLENYHEEKENEN